MNGWRGSLTIEAALVVPLVLALFAFAMKSGIQMYTECRDTALAIGQEQEIEAVKMFYRWQEAGNYFKMKIQYIRKLTASYMVLAQCEELQEWEKKMIAHAPKGNIVFAECVQENGEKYLWYNITGKQALDAVLETETFSYDMLCNVLN